jgi:hypothetical protein
MRTDSNRGLWLKIPRAACGLALACSAAMFGAVAPPTPAGLGEALADPNLAAALSTSSEGLYEETLPDGSVMVRLQGRFQNVAFATLSRDGSVQVSHRSPAASLLALDPPVEPQICRPIEMLTEEEDHATP